MSPKVESGPCFPALCPRRLLARTMERARSTKSTAMTMGEPQHAWAMYTCLAHIGIAHPEFRPRAIGIGERLGVLKDYPTPPNCTSPYAPVWIGEMVRRAAPRVSAR